MMTLEQLNAIRQRAEKAKAGRWMSLETNTLGPSIYDIVTEAQEKGLHYGVCVTYHRGTADFLAHSISDIPALLDEVESLQGALRGSRAKANVMTSLWKAAEEEMRSEDPVEVRLRKDLEDADEAYQALGKELRRTINEMEALQRELEDLHSGRTIPRIAQEQVSADAKARRAEYNGDPL